MPLTPEDVSNKRFTPVRLREGYDMGEVDQFLDEVEAELDRLNKENEDLRSKLSAANGGEPVTASAVPDKAEGKPAAAQSEASTEKSDASGAAAATAPRETIKVVTASEASSAALRLLELATKNADEVVAEAKEEADQIVGSARTEAERVESESKAKVDQLEQEARTRAQNLNSETDAKRAELLGDMEKERTRLDGEVETLRAFEREYRSRLKSYFTEQLQALEGQGEGGELPDAGEGGEPRRLKSILGTDGAGQDGAGSSTDQDEPSDEPAAKD
jgi:DivIVA domain-containing protein